MDRQNIRGDRCKTLHRFVLYIQHWRHTAKDRKDVSVRRKRLLIEELGNLVRFFLGKAIVSKSYVGFPDKL